MKTTTDGLTEAQIKHMVGRFLGWKLPQPFQPDGGISFEPIGNKGTPHAFNREPTGTNLWGWTEAEAMVRHMIEGLPLATARAAEYPAQPIYDFTGAYMADPKCFMELDHDGQVLLMKDIAENVGWHVSKNPLPDALDREAVARILAPAALQELDRLLAKATDVVRREYVLLGWFGPDVLAKADAILALAPARGWRPISEATPVRAERWWFRRPSGTSFEGRWSDDFKDNEMLVVNDHGEAEFPLYFMALPPAPETKP